ncbi:MAG: DUF3410 domain-containing protein, partial [Ignavibacteria bacterium]|nr:DUF3410 domain-containing protein [Ignavibacteria bacterium]
GDELKLYNLLSSVYNIEGDDRRMRNIIKLTREERGKYFDQLRKEYPLRREFSNYTVKLREDEFYFKYILETLGYKTKEY